MSSDKSSEKVLRIFSRKALKRDILAILLETLKQNSAVPLRLE